MRQQRKTRPRWPKGTYMKLRSGATLRALMDQNGKSLADVGRYAGVHRSFIWALTHEEKKTCKPEVGGLIADLLNVPVGVLFDVAMTTADSQNDSQQKTVAA